MNLRVLFLSENYFLINIILDYSLRIIYNYYGDKNGVKKS